MALTPVAQQIVGHLNVAKVGVTAARALGTVGDSQAVRDGAIVFLNQALTGLKEAKGREAQAIIGPGVNFAHEAWQNLEAQRMALASGGTMDLASMSNAGKLIDRVLARFGTATEAA